MNPKLHFSTDDLEAAFQEIRAGEAMHSVADALGIPTPRLQALYNDAHPNTVTLEETKPVVKKQKRTHITPTLKNKIIAATKQGSTASQIIEQFGVSRSTVDNIRHKMKKTPKEKPVVEKKRAVKLTEADSSNLSVTVETDYIVVRIPRKHILAAVLRDLI